MATRNGKIANLPNDVREQLNLRLLDGDHGRELVAWLNALPEVQSVLGSQFNASPISEVNLTLWRQGGYLQWFTERECFDSARALADADCNLATTGLSAERLLNVLTVRFGQLLMRWDFSADEGASNGLAFSETARKARILQGISRSLLAIHRIQSQSARAKSATVRSSPDSVAALNSSSSAIPSKANRQAPFRRAQGFEPTEGPVVEGKASRIGTKHSVPLTAPDRPAAATPKQPAQEIDAQAKSLFPVSAEPPRRGAGGGKERGEPVQILSGPIIPASVPLVFPQTPVKAELDLREILAAA